MDKRKVVVSHNGVKIYHSWKGAQAQTYWYALVPDHPAEGGGQDFDVRRLPRPYLQGLDVEGLAGSADAEARLQAYERRFEAHKAAIRRAIEAGHDLLIERRPAHIRLWRKIKARFPVRPAR